MTMIDVLLPKPHPTQAEALKNSARFTLYNCGRRWGKDVILMRKAIKFAIQGKPVGWFAPTYKMIAENWKEIRHRVSPIARRINEQEKRIELMGGGLIDFWSLDFHDAARGRKYGHVTINEAARVRGLLDAWNMVIRPTLADMRGSADFGSTPKGLNDFFTLWNLAAESPDWSRYHYSTYDNPFIPRDELDAMRSTMPERVFQQEILAEFIADGAYFQNIDQAAIIEYPDQPEQHVGHMFVAGLDWALSEDFTVLTIACRECNRVVYWDRFNQIDYTYQRERVINACRAWHVHALLPERNSIGEPNIEMLIQAGIPISTGVDGRAGFNTTSTTKPLLIQGLASALEHERFLVPSDYADELRMYEVETLSGHPRFSAPSGAHDDRVISLALAWYAMSHVPWLISS